MSRLQSWLCGACVLAVSGCSPALNWRDVRPEAADGLLAHFPCKPDSHVRELAWPGADKPVTMRMLSCQTDEGTWALSYVTLPDANLVPPALQAFTAMMRRNLAAASQMAEPAADQARGQGVKEVDLGPIQVPHMTPMPQAHGWRFQAQRPDGLGRPLDMDIQTWHFSHGMTVFQASVWRPAVVIKAQTSEDVAEAFFRGLHFPG